MCKVLVELIKDSGQATVNSCYGKGSTRKTRPGCFLFSYQKQKGVAVFSTLRTNYCSTTSTYPVHSLGWRQDAKDGFPKIVALQEYGLTKPPLKKLLSPWSCFSFVLLDSEYRTTTYTIKIVISASASHAGNIV